SYAQQRLLFLWQLEPDSSFYNVPMAVRLHGRLDEQVMRNALDLLVRRHETLRTRFVSVDGTFYQEVLEASSVVLDVACFDKQGSEASLASLVRSELSQSFDLLAGPLLRVKLLRLGETEHLLTLCMHHIVCDGWSGEL